MAEEEDLEGDALLLGELEDVRLDLIGLEPKDEGPEEPLEEASEAEHEPPASAMTKHAYRIGLSGTETKAGLEGVDKTQVNKIIYEMSKNSRYFQNERRKEVEMERRIAHMKKQLVTVRDQAVLGTTVDLMLSRFEQQRDLSQTMLHVDMDAFFVEMRDNPSLVGKPMAVGGMSMLSTSNYEARKYGVRSAMPGFIAKELCPDLIIVPSNFEKYKEASKLTRSVYEVFDPSYMMASLDEAYLNITAYLRAHPETIPTEVAKEIQARIFALTSLTCSIGIAPNKMLAKICTDMRKPNGVYELASDRDVILNFLRPLPVRKISGIGKVTEKMLQVVGIQTCGQLFDQRLQIFKIFHESSAHFFLRASMGISSTQLVHRDRKSISTERTFRGLSEPSAIIGKCHDIVANLSRTMKGKELVGKTLTVKLKATSFTIRTKSVTLHKYTNDEEEMFKTAIEMVKAEFPISIRLLGVRMSSLRRMDEPDEPVLPGQRRIDQLLQQKPQAPPAARQPQSLSDQQSQQQFLSPLSSASSHSSGLASPPVAAALVSVVLSPCPICNEDGFATETALTQHVETCLAHAGEDAAHPIVIRNALPASKRSASTAGPGEKPAKKGKAVIISGQRTLNGFLKEQ